MPGGSGGAKAPVDLDAPTGPGQASCTEAAEKMGIPHPGCFVQRVRKNLKRKELGFCVAQKSE